VSGIAGPDGGSDNKPVGMVWFAWKVGNLIEQQEKVFFTGNREEVRKQACCYALHRLLELLS